MPSWETHLVLKRASGHASSPYIEVLRLRRWSARPHIQKPGVTTEIRPPCVTDTAWVNNQKCPTAEGPSFLWISTTNFTQTDEIHKSIYITSEIRKGRKCFLQNPQRSTVSSLWDKKCDLIILFPCSWHSTEHLIKLKYVIKNGWNEKLNSGCNVSFYRRDPDSIHLTALPSLERWILVLQALNLHSR